MSTTVVTSGVLREWPLPPPGDDKHSRGSVLVVGGAARSPGAVLLAGLAALRVGAGKLQLAVAAPVAATLAIAVPEAMVVPLPCDEASGSIEPEAADVLADLLSGADAVCVGPGLDDAGRTGALVPRLLAALPENTGAVLDAYALGALAERPETAAPLAGRLVLTPNHGEAAILLDEDPPGDDELVGAARRTAERYTATVTLRGVTADPAGGCWQDGAGHAGLGTSGSGDVLAGLVAGLLARGATPSQAAVWGTHLHATAGERLSARVGPLGFLARELLDEVPQLLVELSG
jgi:ADP-dependent NAD(P)H-hydrate dehydratase